MSIGSINAILFMKYLEAISFENLYKGLQKSKRGVMWKDSVAGYSLNGLKNTYKLRESLLNGKYKISDYQRFKIYEPKEREILATRIKDRQFQRSLCDNIIYPQLTNSFIRDNCACQKFKGVDDCLNRIKTHLHRYYRKHGCDGWVLKCDIHHYFPETNHEVAKQIIKKMLEDEQAYLKMCEIIDSFGDEKGIGLGSQASQLIELSVLNDLDHYIKEQLHIKYYIRYMDDFILISDSKEQLKNCLVSIAKVVKDLRLNLNPKTCIYPLKQGVKMLKWRFILTNTGKIVMRMSRESIIHQQRKLKKLKSKLDKGKIKIEDVRNNMQSWKANAKRGDTYRIVSKMENLYFNLFKEKSP